MAVIYFVLSSSQAKPTRRPSNTHQKVRFKVETVFEYLSGLQNINFQLIGMKNI